MKNTILIILSFQLFISCSDIDNNKNDTPREAIVSTQLAPSAGTCYMNIKNENLKQQIKLFTQEISKKEKGFGVTTLRLFKDKELRTFYRVSLLRSDYEFIQFNPICYTVIDSSSILIKIDELEQVFKPLNIEQFSLSIEKTNNQIISSRPPFWLIEERNDSIIVLEKRI